MPNQQPIAAVHPVQEELVMSDDVLHLDPLSPVHTGELWNMAESGMRSLESQSGIFASSREEAFGCLFGRDSLISSLKLLNVVRRTGDRSWLPMIRTTLDHLQQLQGREENIESGEQPGKIIHEYRPDRHEHLTRDNPHPWYVYPDGRMRIYDSLDATPLFLIAVERYVKIADDPAAYAALQPSVRMALEWLLRYSDQNGDGLIDFQPHPQRQHGGLVVQSWMDSTASLVTESGRQPVWPIAPVEVQGYAWLALRLWAGRFAHQPELAQALQRRADDLRDRFNRTFVTFQHQSLRIAAGIDGDGQAIDSERSSIGHLLWASLRDDDAAAPECILHAEYIPHVVGRLMSPDLFEPAAGFRTLSSASKHYQAFSYHNGSIWPHDTAMTIEGLRVFGYDAEATAARDAFLRPFLFYRTPIEMVVVEHGQYQYYREPGTPLAALGDHVVCRVQAWSAASLLDELSRLMIRHKSAIETAIPKTQRLKLPEI